jgi:hypothetical protein
LPSICSMIIVIVTIVARFSKAVSSNKFRQIYYIDLAECTKPCYFIQVTYEWRLHWQYPLVEV